MKFRKRPVIIDAIQWDGSRESIREIVEVLGMPRSIYNFALGWNPELYIHTLEGTHIANKGDYIVKGVKGEFYPVKPDIFRKTYEEVK